MKRPIPLFRIKVCGITNSHDARWALAAGADAIGLNFYPKSPRFVNNSAAKEIVDEVCHFSKSNPAFPSPRLVGVFVDATLDEIQLTVNASGINTVQLHGDEPLGFLCQLKSEFNAGFGEQIHKIAIVKAIRLNLNSSEQIQLELQKASQLINSWKEAGCDGILLDSCAPGQFGGSGLRLPWSLLTMLETEAPLILAGGLTPDNVLEAITKSGLRGVDVASGVETSPGIKDAAKVQQFVANCRW